MPRATAGLDALAFLAVLVLAPAVSAQERVSGEVRVGGGYDSNPALAADPASRRQPGNGRGRPGPPPEADGLARIEGWIGGRLGGSPYVSARFDLDGRVYGGGDVLFWERLIVEGALPIDDVAPRCRLEGTRLDLSASADSAWGGALACGAIGRLPLGFWLAGELEGGVRAFDAGQLDGLIGAELSAGWELGPIALELGLGVVRRESDHDQARRTDLSPWMAVRVSTEHVGGRASYRYVAREFDLAERTGGEHVGRAELWGMLFPWLGAYAALEVGYAHGGPRALVYERLQVTGGVRLAFDWQWLAEPEPSSRSAIVLEDGSVHFAYDLPGAERVSVVGDFNGWDEARGRLERTEGARFEGRLPVGPGRHEYHLLVDGAPVRPPDAARYVRDDFGSENAVLVVGESP